MLMKSVRGEKSRLGFPMVLLGTVMLCLMAVVMIPEFATVVYAASSLEYSAAIFGGKGYVTDSGQEIQDAELSSEILDYQSGKVIHLVVDEITPYQVFRGWRAVVTYSYEATLWGRPLGYETTIGSYTKEFTGNEFAPDSSELSYSQSSTLRQIQNKGQNVYCRMQIEAMVETKTGTVSFETGRYGEGTMNSVTMDQGTNYVFPECGFTGTKGFAFWQWDCGKPGDEVLIEGDIVLTALWTKDCTVNFDPNGGLGEMESVLVTDGDYTLPECTFTAMEGYEFDTWDMGPPGTSIVVEEDLEIHAVWKELDYSVALTTENFDLCFLDFLKIRYDLDVNGVLTASELAQIKTIDIPENLNIASMNGIEHFLWLENLTIKKNRITSLDVSGCKRLKTLKCGSNNLNGLTTVIASGLEELTTIDCSDNASLVTLDVSGCTGLKTINCSSTRLTSLDVSGLGELTTLYCYNTPLEALNVKDCVKLQNIDCTNCNLKLLDVTSCKALAELKLKDNKQLRVLQVAGLKKLKSINAENDNLTKLDLTGLTALENLVVANNHLNSLNLGDLPNLVSLRCEKNLLEILDLRGVTALEEADCGYNALRFLLVDGLPKLKSLTCNDNLLSYLDLRGDTALITVIAGTNKLRWIYMGDSTLLEKAVLFSNLLCELELSKYPELAWLDLDNNDIYCLDPSHNPKLTNLYLKDTVVTELDISQNPLLESLTLTGTNIQSLDVSGNPKLRQGGGGFLSVGSDVAVYETAPGKNRITLAVEPAGSGRVLGEGNWRTGDWTTIFAIPAEGYLLRDWTEAGEVVSLSMVEFLSMDGDRNLVAHFEKGCQVSFDANGGLGSMDSVTYPTGMKYTLPDCEFMAPQGKTFKKWNLGYKGETIELTGDLVLVPEWTDGYTVTLDYIDQTGVKHTTGNFRLKGSGAYEKGKSATVIGTMYNTYEAYKVKCWLENGEVVSEDGSYTFTVTGDRELTVVFVSAVYVTYYGGSDSYFEAFELRDSFALPECMLKAPEGKRFSHWMVNGNVYHPGDVCPIGTNHRIVVDAVWRDCFDLVGANMNLGNEISMNFYLNKSDIDASKEYYAEIKKEYVGGPTAVRRIPMSKWVSYNEDMYKVVFNGIAAKEMNDRITVQIFEKDGTPVSHLREDGVVAYVKRALESQTPYVKTAMVDMLNYGAAAQKALDYDTENLANSWLSTEQKAYASKVVSGTNAQKKILNYQGCNLNLGSNLCMNMYFTTLDPEKYNTMYAVLTYKNHNGKECSVRVDGSKFMKYNDTLTNVRVEVLAIAEVNNAVECKVYSKNGNVLLGHGIDSIGGYIARQTNTNEVFDAIMKFSASAYKCFHPDEN